MAEGHHAIAISEESAAAARALSETAPADVVPASFDAPDFSNEDGKGSVPWPVTIATLALAACGGGGAAPQPAPAPPPVAIQPTRTEAGRFLAQAAMGATKAHVEQVATFGYAAWLDGNSRCRARSATGTGWSRPAIATTANADSEPGFDPVMWRQLIARPTAALARRHGAARHARRRHRRRQPAVAAIRGRRLCRHADGRRLRQFPHAAAEHLDQRRDGLIT